MEISPEHVVHPKSIGGAAKQMEKPRANQMEKPEQWPASGQCSVTIAVQDLRRLFMCHNPEKNTVE